MLYTPQSPDALDEATDESSPTAQRQNRIRRFLLETAASGACPVAYAGVALCADGLLYTTALLIEPELVPDVVSALMALCDRLIAFAAECEIDSTPFH